VNAYGAVVLAALVLTYAVNLLADLLNLRSLSTRLPEEFQGVFDPSAYERSQSYARVRTRFDAVAAGVDLAKLLVFWFAGGFGALDGLLLHWSLPPLVHGMLYVGILLAANELFSLPFDVYSTFVIEERFGFNKTTPVTFVADRLKSYVLSAILGGVFLAGVLAFLHWAGPRAWIYIWITATAFVLLLQFVAPTLIMPLFNKFTPLADGELKEAILAYARSVDFPLRGIFVIDGSKRSTKANAFFTGFGKAKRIALFDTLIARHSVPEMVAVLAHEIGHYKKGHIVKGMVLSILHFGLLSYLLSLFVASPGLFRAFGMDRVDPAAGLVFFSLLYTPISFALSMLLQAISRANEYEADRYSAETARDPESLVRALKTLSVTNLANLTPHPFYVFLKYTHPPVLQRIRAIRRTA
jgi:STE24 endopeptidase